MKISYRGFGIPIFETKILVNYCLVKVIHLVRQIDDNPDSTVNQHLRVLENYPNIYRCILQSYF